MHVITRSSAAARIILITCHRKKNSPIQHYAAAMGKKMNGSTLSGLGEVCCINYRTLTSKVRPPLSVLTKGRVETRPFYQETKYNGILLLLFFFLKISFYILHCSAHTLTRTQYIIYIYIHFIILEYS